MMQKIYFFIAAFLLLSLLGSPAYSQCNMIIVALDGSGQFTSIQDAINSIIDNSDTNRFTVYVKPGTYVENVTLNKSYVDLVGEPNLATILKSPNAKAITLAITNSSNNTISNLCIQGDVNSGGTSVLIGNRDWSINSINKNITIQNCHIEKAAIGIWIIPSTDPLNPKEPITIRDNEINVSNIGIYMRPYYGTIGNCKVLSQSNSIFIENTISESVGIDIAYLGEDSEFTSLSDSIRIISQSSSFHTIGFRQYGTEPKHTKLIGTNIYLKNDHLSDEQRRARIRGLYTHTGGAQSFVSYLDAMDVNITIESSSSATQSYAASMVWHGHGNAVINLISCKFKFNTPNLSSYVGIRMSGSDPDPSIINVVATDYLSAAIQQDERFILNAIDQKKGNFSQQLTIPFQSDLQSLVNDGDVIIDSSTNSLCYKSNGENYCIQGTQIE